MITARKYVGGGQYEHYMRFQLGSHDNGYEDPCLFECGAVDLVDKYQCTSGSEEPAASVDMYLPNYTMSHFRK
jgi:hypothetical protein